ncbi:hypothetical protein OHA37_26900 [Streptomyces sp. NBC_00335]|uniref:hypothetical protein n=1 Tax=unclassified Streptomyces TaxID=2593676 RepID=UPI00224F4F36|nr:MULTISPECIES: hypothetical protein [unclassified Streptomyces]MCX5407479.1 hypothetical protein [Streptomyces sp. NBC_00086]
MPTPPTLRDRALDAVKQAINTLGMWLPPAGREAVVDAVLATTAAEACCVCGGGPVTYRNYREQPFCQPCADGQPRVCTHCGGDGYDPEDPGDYDPAVHQHNPSTRQPCPECIQKGIPPRLDITPHANRDTCLDNPQLTAAIGYPVRCPHCETTVPPTHWTKHLQRHHPDVGAFPAAGYCPHCGRGDAGPTADEYEALRKRARQDAAASRESERQLQQQIDRQAKEIDRLRDALAGLHEGEESHPEAANSGSPAQWIWSWNRAAPEQRLDMAGRILAAFETADGCFLLNHKTETPRRKSAEATIERVREVAAWLRLNYPGLDAGQRVLAALEPPKEVPDA